jgi:hypothetical protein
MTLAEIKNQIMFQTNNDEEDIEDYLPHVVDYINDGYDRIMQVWQKDHIPGETYEKLAFDSDEPELPEWLHRYICDWATWLVYRNGNPQKQNRGMAYRYSFEEVLSKIAGSGGAEGLNADGSMKRYKNFINIPR